MEKKEANEIGVLWSKTSRNGNAYYSGKVSVGGQSVEIVVFHIVSKNPRGPKLKIVQSHFEAGKDFYANDSEE